MTRLFLFGFLCILPTKALAAGFYYTDIPVGHDNVMYCGELIDRVLYHDKIVGHVEFLLRDDRYDRDPSNDRVFRLIHEMCWPYCRDCHKHIRLAKKVLKLGEFYCFTLHKTYKPWCEPFRRALTVTEE